MSKGVLGLFCAAVLGMAVGAETEPEAKAVVSHAFQPARRDFSEELMSQLHVPAGFRISVFARNLGNPRMMRLLPNGTIVLSRFDQGDVLALQDGNGDGVADEIRTVVNIPGVHGLAVRGSTLYLASTTKLFSMPFDSGGNFGSPAEFAQLPEGPKHPRRTLGFDSAGFLYVSVGSTCNACVETEPENATILRMKPDGSQRTIFARGLRDTIGFDWHPQTRQLWGWDNGTDLRGDTSPPEELNLLRAGAHYGWPFCFGKGRADMISRAEAGGRARSCAGTVPAVLNYQAHSVPLAFIFYHGTQFPAQYRQSGFVAFHGSWNRMPAAGYKVACVRFVGGQPVAIQNFVNGWLIENGQAQFGRPAGLVVAGDGALLISDDANGVIYRVAYGRG